MVKLFRMEDPMNGKFFLEVLGPSRIDADLGLIPAERGPDFSSPLAKGDGRAPRFSQPEMGPAKQAAFYLNGGSSAVGSLPAFP
jgi:hypothetical protein